MPIPEMILELRERLNLNRQQLTAILGLRTRLTTRYWERGVKSPNIESAYKLIQLAKTAGLDWKIEDFITIQPRKD